MKPYSTSRMPFVVETQCIASLPRPPVRETGTAVVSPQLPVSLPDSQLKKLHHTGRESTKHIYLPH
ncbi:hypothetical protein Barb4_00548 [Bacteroidales bacterium Barb4]|nr:hypothetical protein Barb4_00548 [Bacteroidales bacterium Barb4]